MTAPVQTEQDDVSLEDSLESSFGALADALAADDAHHTDDALEHDDEALTDDTPAADPKDPAAKDTPTEPEPDPLADAKALDYVVNGQAKTYDGVRVLYGADGKPSGAVIPPERLQEIRDRMQRNDHLETANKALYQKVSELDRVEFKAGTQTLKGMDAVQQAFVENARSSAALKLFTEYLDFENPAKLLALAYAAQEKDQTEFDRLLRDLKAELRDAEFTARQSFTQRQASVQTAEQQQQERQSITTNALTTSITHWATRYPALTPDDLTAVRAQLEKVASAVVRQATPDEAVRAGVRPGDFIIDHAVVDQYLADRAAIRAELASTVTTTTKADQSNAKRLKAALAGKPAGKAPASATQTPRTRRVTTPPDDEGETWQQQKDRMMAGMFAPDTD